MRHDGSPRRSREAMTLEGRRGIPVHLFGTPCHGSSWSIFASQVQMAFAQPTLRPILSPHYWPLGQQPKEAAFRRFGSGPISEQANEPALTIAVSANIRGFSRGRADGRRPDSSFPKRQRLFVSGTERVEARAARHLLVGRRDPHQRPPTPRSSWPPRQARPASWDACPAG